MVTQSYNAGAGGSSREDDGSSRGHTKPQRHALAAVLQAGRTERDEILERKVTDVT